MLFEIGDFLIRLRDSLKMSIHHGLAALVLLGNFAILLFFSDSLVVFPVSQRLVELTIALIRFSGRLALRLFRFRWGCCFRRFGRLAAKLRKFLFESVFISSKLVDAL